MFNLKLELKEALLKFENLITPLDYDTNNMNIDVNYDDLNKIKNISWNEIELEDLPSNDNKRFKFQVKLPFNNNFEKEIKVAIDLKGGILYQMDVSVPNKIQKLGLMSKIYKFIIMNFGHVYSAKARVHNENINKIFSKLNMDSDIDCLSGNKAQICCKKDNPNKNKLFQIVKGL